MPMTDNQGVGLRCGFKIWAVEFLIGSLIYGPNTEGALSDTEYTLVNRSFPLLKVNRSMWYEREQQRGLVEI